MNKRFVQLSDVCDLQNGFAFKSTDYVEKSNTCNIRMSNIRPGGSFNEFHNERYLPDSYATEYKDYLLNDGDLIIAMTDMATETKILGLPTLVNNTSGRSFLLNQRVGKLCNFSKDIYVPYLRHILTAQDVIDYYKSKGAGGLQINISKKDILSVKFPLPAIPTQKKIVAKLDAIFSEINIATAAAEENANNAEALFQSYLSKIIERNSENSKVVKLGMICEIARGGSPRPIDKFITDDKDGINWIKIGDATRSKKYIFETREKIIKDGVSRSRLVKDGDFLLSNSMSYGRPYIMRTTGCIHDGWLVLSKYQEFLDIDYFYFLLSSAIVVKQFDNLAQGSTVSNLNKELVSRVEVKLPSLSNQKLIVSKLNLLTDNVDIVKNSYINKIRELLKFKQAILQRAFSGELVKD